MITNNGNLDVLKDMVANLEMQLVSLYAEKEYLERELGTSDPVIIVHMIKSMEKQLVELYGERKESVVIDSQEIVIKGAKKIIIKKSTNF